MIIIKYPTEKDVDTAISQSEPLLALIAFDGTEMIVSHIDEAVEHHILLSKAGRKDVDIDRYFRIVIDEDGADWTFVCPTDYKGITCKDKRLSEFYKDGFDMISSGLLALGMIIGINIPKRYKRHFEMIGG